VLAIILQEPDSGFDVVAGVRGADFGIKTLKASSTNKPPSRLDGFGIFIHQTN